MRKVGGTYSSKVVDVQYNHTPCLVATRSIPNDVPLHPSTTAVPPLTTSSATSTTTNYHKPLQLTTKTNKLLPYNYTHLTPTPTQISVTLLTHSASSFPPCLLVRLLPSPQLNLYCTILVVRSSIPFILLPFLFLPLRPFLLFDLFPTVLSPKNTIPQTQTKHPPQLKICTRVCPASCSHCQSLQLTSLQSPGTHVFAPPRRALAWLTTAQPSNCCDPPLQQSPTNSPSPLVLAFSLSP